MSLGFSSFCIPFSVSVSNQTLNFYLSVNYLYQ